MKHTRTSFFLKGEQIRNAMSLFADCETFYLIFYGMLRSTCCLLYLTFYTFVVLVSAVVQAPVLFGAWTTVAIVIRSAFVERIETPGIARGHHRKVVWSFSILRENSQNWNQCDKQDKFHHVLGPVSLFCCSSLVLQN